MQGVRQILIHPDYKPSNSSHPGDNDIGMMTLSYYLARTYAPCTIKFLSM